MTLIEWSDSLSVGFAEMDEDHKKLVELVNRLNKVVIEDADGKVIADILSELLSYTQWHFRHEERLMQQYAYPGLNLHKEEHEALTSQALKLNEKYQGGDATVPGMLMPFLKNWLTNHILGTDKQTGQYLAALM